MMRAIVICAVSTILAVVLISGCVTTHEKRIPCKKNPFALHLLTEKEQKDVWRFSTFLVDLDKLELQHTPLITEKDIESFDRTAIRLKKPFRLPYRPTATGLYFVIVVDGDRELLGSFLPTWSSLWPDKATTVVHWPGDTVEQINVPSYCKGLNAFLRRLPYSSKPSDTISSPIRIDKGITAKISLDSTNIRFKKDFSVPIIIENHTDKEVRIDTSSDEVIEYPSEKSGGVYQERGSRCMVSVTQQDSNGRLGFFSTTDRKVEPQNKNRNSFTIKPGKTHTLKYRVSPWGPTYGALRPYAALGPAEIEGELKLFVEGQQLNVPLQPVRINFVK